MAFVRVEKTARGGGFGLTGIRMSASLQDEKTNYRGIYISISGDVVKQTRWLLIDSDKRINANVEIMEGVDDDAGFWMLQDAGKNPDKTKSFSFGAEKRKSQSMSSMINIARLKHYVLNECPAPAVDCEFTVEKDGSILLQLPDWLRYNPQSYKEPDKPKPDAPPLIESKKKEKPAPRPTLVTVPDVDGDEDKLNLNRRQRRAITAALVKRL